jgi:hypothetical protein
MNRMEIGLPDFFGLVVGVADIESHLPTLPADCTCTCHGTLQSLTKIEHDTTDFR